MSRDRQQKAPEHQADLSHGSLPLVPPAPSPEPTERDRANARIRLEVAERQEAEYVACLKLAFGAFGPGWLPSHRHFLVEKEEEERVRYTGERARPAVTVHTVKNAECRARHFTVEEGRVYEHESYEAGFGSMLLEPHPTRGFEHGGRWHRTHRYSLCFAPYELYTPRTAEQLAALRGARERRKAEREDRKWKANHPLLAWAGLLGPGQEGDDG